MQKNFQSIHFQVASARLIRRPSKDIPYSQQRWHPLWLANNCCSADQRPVWRCGACAKYEGRSSMCIKAHFFYLYIEVFSEFIFFPSDFQVEVKAVPVSQKKSLQQDNMKKLQRLPGSPSNSASGMDLTFGGLPAPKLEATYEPMIIKEARYIAITMMKVQSCCFVYMETNNK